MSSKRPKRISKKKRDAVEQLKKDFKKWQEKLGLVGYQIYFEVKELQDSYAIISIDEIEHVATLSIDPQEILDIPDDHDVAKHEALHLFLHSLVHAAKDRYTSKEAIDSEWERLTRMLEKLL